MLVFKAYRKSPALTQETTPSQRRITRILSDAQQAAAREFDQNLSTVAEMLSRGQVDRVVAMLPTEPWLMAQEALAAELLGELLDAGSRVTLPAIEKATLAYSFDRERPESSQWARHAAGMMISQITGEQRDVVRDVVSAAALGVGDWGDVAQSVRGSIGLTTQQAGWVSNHYDRAYLTAIRSGMGTAQARTRARESASRYQTSVHRYRANTIARTETMRAASEGRMQAWNQGLTQGFISPLWEKEWVAEASACDICVGMNGKRVPVKGSFSVGEPPAHPNCRCDVILVPPKVQPAGGGTDWAGTAFTALTTVDDIATLGQIGRYTVAQIQEWRQAFEIATEQGDSRSFGEWFEDVIEPDVTVYADEGTGEEPDDIRWFDFEDITDQDELGELTSVIEYDFGQAYQEALDELANKMTTLFDDADWEEKYPQLRDLLVSDPKFAVLFQDFLDGTLELEYMPQVNVLVSTTVRDSHWGTGPYSHISIYGSMFGRNIFHARRSMDIVQGVVYHELFSVKGPFQGLGVGQSLHDSMLELYRRNGMKRIELEANIDVGGYTWARFGFDWTERYSEISSFYVSDDDEDLEDIGYGEMRLDDLRYTIGELLSQVRGKLTSYRILAQQGYIQHWEQQIDEMAGRLDGDESNWPTPAEIAALGYIPGSKSRLWPGKAVMLNSTWNGVYFL